jgi:hypothetical protein
MEFVVDFKIVLLFGTLWHVYTYINHEFPYIYVGCCLKGNLKRSGLSLSTFQVL